MVVLKRLSGAMLALFVCSGWTISQADEATIAHAVSMHGEPKYGPDFEHFDYVNPDAPIGGAVKLAATGTFDTLNPFTLKGVAAAGLGGLFDTLTVQSDDEAFTEYGLVAETIEIPPDHSWVAFTLRPEARFHDGSPMTVEDVIFSFETLKSKGHPFYRTYYANVATVEKIGDRQVRFTFSGGDNRELPLIVGQMPVLSKTYWSNRDFERTTLEAPLSSGAYRIAAIDPGRSITYERVADYWAADLPVRRAQDNFGSIRYDYYRDSTVALQAFKAGEYDLRVENIAKDWATAYDSPALKDGRIRMLEIPHERPSGMQGFLLNTRRLIFKDPRVRQALAYAFDFEWANRTLFYNAYARTESYFANSELAAQGLPSPEELQILEPFRDQLPPEVFNEAYHPPSTAGPGSVRDNLRVALGLLRDAGWAVRNGRLENQDGVPMSFELLLSNPSFERVALPFKRNLQRLGIDLSVRTVDAAQYQKRLDEFDFDMVVAVLGQSLSPGNEQRDFWASEKANQPGGRNLAGIQDPVVDELIELIIAAPDREQLIHRTRALDRVLLWGHYVIPNWHSRVFRVAFWDKFGRPEIAPKYALGFNTWWVDPIKAERLKKQRSGGGKQ